MPDEIPSPQSEQSILEQDIARLVKEVQTHKERPENAGLDDQQILKMALQSIAAHTTTPPLPSSPQQSSTGNADSMLPAYAQSASAETKLEIEYLLDTALRQGLDKANEAARKTNPFVLDAFHDSLAGKMHDEMKRRGLLP